MKSLLARILLWCADRAEDCADRWRDRAGELRGIFPACHEHQCTADRPFGLPPDVERP